MKRRSVLLGVTGSIAAYKAAELARELSRHGVEVRVMMTPAATRFVSPLTFEALLASPVVTDMFDSGPAGPIPHVSLAANADVVLIAPATADCIARIVHGLADDIVSCTVMASECPLIVAPAMHENMYRSTATQANIAALQNRGAVIVGPDSGDLASGGKGAGRMSPVETIIGITLKTLGRHCDLAGRTIVVTAGGTQEPIDPVRCITNRSSGKMGYAIAEASRDRGASVVLVTAPTSLTPPAGVEVVQITSAQEMFEATQSAVRHAQALIMAAAVADYRPTTLSSQKIKKKGQGMLTIQLEPTIDILGSIHGNFVKVGFAAESTDLELNAETKLTAKGLDLIVANDITATDAGFGSESNRVVIIDRQGGFDRTSLLSKREVADRVLDRVVQLLS